MHYAHQRSWLVAKLAGVSEGSGAADEDRLREGDPGEETLGAALLVAPLVQVHPHAPVVPEHRQRVPPVQPHTLRRPHHPRARTAVQPERYLMIVLMPK